MIIFSILLLLLSNAVTLRRDKSILFSRVAIIVLLYSSLIAVASLYFTYLDRGIGLYGGLFHTTSTTQLFHIFIFLISATILQLTGFYPRKVWVANYSSINKLFLHNFIYYRTKILDKMGEQFKIIEYPLILLFIITGAVFLVSTSDLVSIFLSIELQSYGLYLLSTLYRNSELATNAGLTYFLLGGLSSCFILLGTSLLYANSGTTNLDGVYVITSLSDIGSNNSSNVLYWYKSYYINFSLLILSVGFLFKVSAAPFHFWSPDVYDAIPTIVTTFVAIVAKISIFVFFLELVHYTNNSLFAFQFSWTSTLLVSSLLSLIIGTVVGLTQFRIKRLYAYSTISHVGFILLALSINSIESIQAFIFYLMQYSISNLNAFIILISIGYSLFYYVNKNEEYKQLVDKKNSPIQLISQLKGYFYINPVLALSLAITIFSFVGIPPLIGFFAKQMVLSAALDSGFVFLTLVAILTSVISAVYYLSIIKEIFFYEPIYKISREFRKIDFHGNIVRAMPSTSTLPDIKEDKKNNILIEKLTFKLSNITLSSSLTITISLLTLIILLFIFVPQEWLSMANILALILFNP
jgi:NADH-ubiquinone oxidoreductase chain 2